MHKLIAKGLRPGEYCRVLKQGFPVTLPTGEIVVHPPVVLRTMAF